MLTILPMFFEHVLKCSFFPHFILSYNIVAPVRIYDMDRSGHSRKDYIHVLLPPLWEHRKKLLYHKQ